MQHQMSQPMQQQQSNYALQDYQMQMALLEQQNRKRLLMARQEQKNASNPSNQKEPHDAEQQQPTHKSLAKAPLDPSSAQKTAVINVEKQCGVVLPTGRQCTRSLTCKSHSVAAKRAVPGRSLPYDMLLAQYRKENGAQPQGSCSLPVSPLLLIILQNLPSTQTHRSQK
jgi:SCA7, zinc-binding domain